MPDSAPSLWPKKFCSWRVMPIEESEPEPRVLPGPFGRRISQICDADSAGQASIDRGHASQQLPAAVVRSKKKGAAA